MKTTRKLVALGAMATLAVAASACSGASGSGSSGSSYQIGGTLSLTGGFASLSNAWKDGISAYFNSVNAKGGINGHKVQLTLLDDQANASTGVSNVKQLIQQNHVSAAYVYLSNVAVASAPILNAVKTPAIMDAPTLNMIKPTQPELYGGAQVLSGEPFVQIPFAQELLRNKPNARVAVITAQSVVLEAYAAEAKKAAQKAGWSVVTSQQVPSGSTSATAQAQVIANAKPDVILMALPAPLQISAVTALQQDKITAPILSFSGGAAYSTLKQLADPHMYVDSIAPFSNMNAGPGMTQALTAAKSQKIDPNESLYFSGFANGELVGKALQKCGYPCSPAQMTKAMNSVGSVPADGLFWGSWVWTGTNHRGPTSVGVSYWDPAKSEPVHVQTMEVPLA